MPLASFGWLIVVGSAALSVGTSAAAQQTAFHIVSAKTKECLHLRAPDKPGGGGLELKACRSFPDYVFSLERSTTGVTPIMVKLTSSRFVCVVASDEPMASLP